MQENVQCNNSPQLLAWDPLPVETDIICSTVSKWF